MPLGAESVMVKVALPGVALLPSLTVFGLLTDRVGTASSSVMVPVPCVSARVALVGLVRLTTKDSLSSLSTSPTTGTLMLWVSAPGAKVSRPLTAV